jgi:hypothetical protein
MVKMDRKDYDNDMFKICDGSSEECQKRGIRPCIDKIKLYAYTGYNVPYCGHKNVIVPGLSCCDKSSYQLTCIFMLDEWNKLPYLTRVQLNKIACK